MNYNFNWTVIEKNIVPMLEGLGFGLLMAIIAITVGTIIGLLLAFAAVSKSKIARKLVQIFVTIFRNTPILILVYITYFGMPTIGINIPQGPLFRHHVGSVFLRLHGGSVPRRTGSDPEGDHRGRSGHRFERNGY